MMTGTSLIPLTGRADRRRPVAIRPDVVVVHPSLDLRRGERHVGGRRQELEHHPAAVPHSLRVGLDLHPGLDRAGTSRHPGSLFLDFDDADPADHYWMHGVVL